MNDKNSDFDRLKKFLLDRSETDILLHKDYCIRLKDLINDPDIEVKQKLIEASTLLITLGSACEYLGFSFLLKGKADPGINYLSESLAYRILQAKIDLEVQHKESYLFSQFVDSVNQLYCTYLMAIIADWTEVRRQSYKIICGYKKRNQFEQTTFDGPFIHFVEQLGYQKYAEFASTELSSSYKSILDNRLSKSELRKQIKSILDYHVSSALNLDSCCNEHVDLGYDQFSHLAAFDSDGLAVFPLELWAIVCCFKTQWDWLDILAKVDHRLLNENFLTILVDRRLVQYSSQICDQLSLLAINSDLLETEA